MSCCTLCIRPLSSLGGGGNKDTEDLLKLVTLKIVVKRVHIRSWGLMSSLWLWHLHKELQLELVCEHESDWTKEWTLFWPFSKIVRAHLHLAALCTRPIKMQITLNARCKWGLVVVRDQTLWSKYVVFFLYWCVQVSGNPWVSINL